MEITKFIKFHGNSKYFAGLAQTDDSKYMLVYGLIGQMTIKSEILHNEENYNPFWIPITEEVKSTVEIPFIENNNRHLFTFITLHDKDEYDTILSLLEVIYGE